jgi:hypothetical protein
MKMKCLRRFLIVFRCLSSTDFNFVLSVSIIFCPVIVDDGFGALLSLMNGKRGFSFEFVADEIFDDVKSIIDFREFVSIVCVRLSDV